MHLTNFTEIKIAFRGSCLRKIEISWASVGHWRLGSVPNAVFLLNAKASLEKLKFRPVDRLGERGRQVDAAYCL
jgi:hypothetical protein